MYNINETLHASDLICCKIPPQETGISYVNANEGMFSNE